MPEQVNIDSRPPAPSWLDQELIQTALRTGDNDPTITLVSCEFSMANAAGDGYMSNMYRAVAQLRDGTERRLVIKCRPQGETHIDLDQKLAAYERETKMFSDTLPAMQKILEKIGVYQPLGAKCLYHGTEPLPYIVLEDLRAAGFTLADRLQGLDMDHCKLILRSHALFHASSLFLYELDPTGFELYRESIYREVIRETFEPFIDSSVRAVEQHVLKWPGYERFSEKIKKVRKNLFNQMIETSKFKEGKFNTLLHGDTWTNNLMFKYHEGTVKDARLLDFQCSYYSSPTIDLQTFLTACSNEEAHDNLEELLKYYHNILVDTMQKLKCKTKIITLEELKRDFNEYSIFGIQVAFCYIPLIMSEVAKTINVDELLHSDDLSSRIVEDASSSGAYERVMKKLLVKYENLGVL